MLDVNVFETRSCWLELRLFWKLVDVPAFNEIPNVVFGLSFVVLRMIPFHEEIRGFAECWQFLKTGFCDHTTYIEISEESILPFIIGHISGAPRPSGIDVEQHLRIKIVTDWNV